MEEENIKNKNKGSLTIEASIILVIFIAAYMTLLSAIDIFRTQNLIQNAANQTALEIAQYTYILNKAGLAEFGGETSDSANAFTDKTNETIGTVFAFFEATSDGVDAGKAVIRDGRNTDYSVNRSITDIINEIEEAESVAQDLEGRAVNIKDKAETMMSAGRDYFSDPKEIFNGILAILKDLTNDAIKIAVAAPITDVIMNKYLSAYPEGYLENLGVVNGKSGINYLGSSILVDMQSIEVKATYTIRVRFPFLDRIDLNMRTTASTRAWLGDGSHNENGMGVKLEAEALGSPGLSENTIEVAVNEDTEEESTEEDTESITEEAEEDWLAGMSPEDARRYEQWRILREAGIDLETYETIINTPKAERPDPETYLSEEYIQEHLAQFNSGATVVMTLDAYNRFVNGKSHIGRPDDGTLFVMPKGYCDEIEQYANGDVSVWEEKLGFDIGYFTRSGGLVRIDIADINGLNIRIPSGREDGVNEHWLPGGYTSGGVPEAVTDLVPNNEDNVTVREIR